MDLDLISSYGIDYKKGLERCFNNDKLYVSLLSAFLKDKSFERVQLAFNNKNTTDLYTNAHELKGVSGNIAFPELYLATCELVDYLKHGDNNFETIDTLFSTMNTAYTKAIAGISSILSTLNQ